MGHFLRPGPCPKHFVLIHSFSPHNKPALCHLHFEDEETKAQTGYGDALCRSPATLWRSQDFRRKSIFRTCVPTTAPHCLTKRDRHIGCSGDQAGENSQPSPVRALGAELDEVVGTGAGDLGTNLREC